MAAADELRSFDSCTVSDALEACGLTGAVNGLAPVWSCGRVVGPAVTMRLRRLEPGEQPGSGPHLGARAIGASRHGDVIVIEHQGRADSAGWGGLLSAAALASGVAGVVLDGAARDVDDALALGFPVFARSVTPVTARGRTVEAEVGGPVRIGDVTVAPGDVVVADRSGVVFVPQAMVAEVAARASALQEREARMLGSLRQGVPAAEVLDASYDRMLVDGPGPAVPGSTATSAAARRE